MLDPRAEEELAVAVVAPNPHPHPTSPIRIVARDLRDQDPPPDGALDLRLGLDHGRRLAGTD
jgi:hypothetical protein